MEHSQHIPVMLNEVLNYLHPHPGGLYIDGTLGGGGHTAALLERSAPDGRVLGIDTDAQSLARVSNALSQYIENGRLVLVHGNFVDMKQIADDARFSSVQGILLDLGFSSDQMDNPQRGFSFNVEGPLDMRLDQSLALSAADIVNGADEQELADIFWRYGEENRSRQIARRIVRERAKHPITSTTQLATLAAAGTPYKAGAIHPATRVFQALRIAVNQELERLEMVLPQMLDLLDTEGKEGSEKSSEQAAEVSGAGRAIRVKKTQNIHKIDKGSGVRGGRMIVIAFHSLEDRIVKEFMRREATDCVCPPQIPVCVCGHKARLQLLTSRPVTPTIQEIEHNPRARSAKLRVAEAIVRA